MNVLSHFSIKSLISLGLLFLAGPLYAAVTYNGADGVYNKIFFQNDSQACISCHSTAIVAGASETYVDSGGVTQPLTTLIKRHYADEAVNFDTYLATQSADPYYVDGTTVAEGAYNRIIGDSMPMHPDPNETTYGTYPSVIDPLSGPEKELITGWKNGGYLEYDQPTKQTNAVTSIGKYAATLNATLNRNGWSYSNNPATTSDTQYIFQIKPTAGVSWTNVGSYLYSNAYNEGTKTISDGGIDTSKSQSATGLSCGTQYDVKIFYRFQYYGGSWYDGSVYGGGGGNVTQFTTNNCPNITTTSLLAATESTFYQTTINATQTGPSQSFSFVGTPPAGMSINNSGVLSWTSPPQAKSNYTVNFTVRVSDGTTTDDQAYSLLVNADDDPPVINSAAPSTGVEGNLYSYAVSVTDPDDANNGTDLTYSLNNAPAGMTVSTLGVVSWTPGNGVTTSGAVTLTVQDALSSASENFTITVTGVNNAPVITPGAPTTATEDILYSYQLAVTDVDDPNDGTNLSYSLINAPSGMTISNTGLIQWTPLEGVTTSGSFTARVADGGENGALPATEDITISVTQVNDAPVINSAAGTSIIEESLYTYQLAITDPDDTDIVNDLTFSLTNNPAGMTISNTGLISWTPARYTTTSGLVTVTVADGGEDGALAATENFTITVSIIDNDADSVADYNDNCPTVSNNNQLNTDGDSEGDACDLDDDNDLIPDVYEIANGLNPLINDAALDNDGDGQSNYNEYLNATDASSDDYPPVITVPDDIVVTASGYLTHVDLGEASAFDYKSGVVRAGADNTGPFVSGHHVITWTARDAALNTATASQNVDVMPLVNLPVDQQVAEGSVVAVKFELSGEAVTYPVIIDYAVAGTADASDHDAVNGSVSINGGTSAVLFVTISADAQTETAETIELTITNVTNAVSGDNNSQTLTIVEENIAPRVNLVVTQNTNTGKRIYLDQGVVMVTADVQDPNPANTVSFDWSNSSSALVAINGTGTTASNQFEFDVSAMSEGNYTVDVLVTDNGSPAAATRVSALLNLQSTTVILSTADSDGDGTDDATEGVTDSDGDGISDYLDAISQSYLIQNQTGIQSSQLLLMTETGLQLKLGRYALGSDRKGALITEADILGILGSSTMPGLELTGSNSIFDIEVDGIQDSSRPVLLVVPLQTAIQSNATIYVLDDQSGWLAFAEDVRNQVNSALPVSEGLCPVPGNAAYRSGLTVLDSCVQLLIEDGGPNDADKTVNGEIKLTLTLDYPQQVKSADDGTNQEPDIGVLHPALLMILALITLFWRYGIRARSRVG